MRHALGLALAALVAQGSPGERPIVVASKPFGESYILCEMFAQLLEARGFRVDRRPGLGATEIAFAALRTNAIDVYPEYTGTGLLAILADSSELRGCRRSGSRTRTPSASGVKRLPGTHCER
jgi:glycine betaine/choline ABC-type transport system substrate-binding protein